MLSEEEIRSDLLNLKEIVAAHKAPNADLAVHKEIISGEEYDVFTKACLLYTSPSPRDLSTSRMPSSA